MFSGVPALVQSRASCAWTFIRANRGIFLWSWSFLMKGAAIQRFSYSPYVAVQKRFNMKIMRIEVLNSLFRSESMSS